MVTDDIAYAEVFEILSYMNKKTVMKIPFEILQFLKENRNKEYISKINPNNIFNPENISNEAREILAYIDLEYLASEKSRKEKLCIYKENEKKYQEELREKYNTDELFKNIKTNINVETQNSINENIKIIEYQKQRWYQKIFDRLLKIFRKN